MSFQLQDLMNENGIPDVSIRGKPIELFIGAERLMNAISKRLRSSAVKNHLTPYFCIQLDNV